MTLQELEDEAYKVNCDNASYTTFAWQLKLICLLLCCLIRAVASLTAAVERNRL